MAKIGVLRVETVINASPSEPNWCEKLYEKKAAELILYGRVLGLSHGEAEDVLQETFIALMKRGAVPEKPEHYIIRAFRNRALNYRRSLWRRLRRELESQRWFESSEQESRGERAAMQGLEKLPPEQREVIVLKIWHRYTLEMIADLLEISPNTVAGRYRYGIKKMRVYLDVESENEYDEQPDRRPVTFLEASPTFPEA